MRILKVLIVFILLCGCTQQVSNESDHSQIDAEITTAPIVTTQPPVTTTSIITTPITTTTTALTTTTPITTTSAPQGSVLSPVTSDYLLGRIEAGDSFFAYLGTTTCPHCQAYKPIVEEVVSEMANIDFFYIMLDTDTGKRQKELVELLSLEYIPLTIRVEKGVVTSQNIGEMTKEDLKEFMN